MVLKLGYDKEKKVLKTMNLRRPFKKANHCSIVCKATRFIHSALACITVRS